MRADSLDAILLELDALANSLKARRVKRTLVNAARRGQGPVLGVTAAISASLVSVAAHETEVDPLDGLAAVDDLSAFGELCLPGEKYADAEGHDHLGAESASSHANHRGGAFYLADPFASRFASSYGDDHRGHGAMGADHPGHHGTGVEPGHPAAHTAANGHAHSAHTQSHEAHQASAGVRHDGDHQTHQSTTELANAPHGDHGGSQHGETYHPSSHAGSGHAGHQQSPQSASAHETHDMKPELTHVAHHASGSEMGVEQLADVGAASPSADAPQVETNSHTAQMDLHDAHHHGPSLADFDAPPLDDLSTIAPPPLI